MSILYRNNKLIFTVPLFLLFSEISGQKIRFDHITVDHGLANSKVYQIYQDSTGFLWFATEDGLSRYDGSAFRNYYHNSQDTNSIRSNIIFNICRSEEDNFWLATYNGIDKYLADLDIFQHIPVYNDLSATIFPQVNHIIKDKDQRFIASSNLGLFVYVPGEEAFFPFHLQGLDKNIIGDNISSIFQDREKNYWFGTYDKGIFLYEYDRKTFRKVSYYSGNRDAFEKNKIICIYEDNERTIWIGTEKGLFSFLHTGSIQRYLPVAGNSESLPHPSVPGIMEDSRNRLWIVTNGGLSVFNRKDNSFINYFHDDHDLSSLNNDGLSCIYEDSQNNIWIGGTEDGLNIIRSSFIEFNNIRRIPNSEKSLNCSYVTSILEDRNGDLWIGTNGGGINHYNRQADKFTFYLTLNNKTPVPGDVIQCIYQDHENNLWFGTYADGLNFYNPENGTFKNFQNDPKNKKSISNNTVNHIIEDSQNRLWIATHGGLNLFNPADDSFSYLKTGNSEAGKSIPDDFLTFLMEDSEGLLWIGSWDGLIVYNHNTGKVLNFLCDNKPGSISDKAILSIHEDIKGSIWIGTRNGLNLFLKGEKKFKTFYTGDGLPNNTINGILEDSRGNLWLSTNKGLSMFNVETVRFINFDVNDGLVGNEFHRASYFKCNKGVLYFGNKKGLVYFSPDKFQSQNISFPLVLTGLYIFNREARPLQEESPIQKSITSVNEIALTHSQSFISFEFASLNYVNPSKDRYSCFLEGYDPTWNETGNQRNISYKNIPPGKYVFHYKVENSICNFARQRSILVSITPPFWISFPAYLIYSLLFLLILFFIYKYIHSKSLYKRSLLIERLEKQKAIEINQSKLQFFINISHEFKTPLTLILSPLEKIIQSGKRISDEEKSNLSLLIYNNAKRLSRLISQIMDLRKIDTGNAKLEACEVDIVRFTKEIFISFNEQAKEHLIDYSFSCHYTCLLIWIDPEKYEKSVFNLLSNAFRYTSDGKTISLSIDKADSDEIGKSKLPADKDYVKITVTDTGSGIPDELHEKIFQRFFTWPTEKITNPTSSGIGLSLVRDFTELHNGKVIFSSKKGEGSIFSILLPLGKDHLKPGDIVERNDTYHITSPDIINPTEKFPRRKKNILTEEHHGRKILVAEDNYELRNYILDNLENTYDVYEAADGMEALKMVYSVLPELVISDIMMPGMSGIELCRTVKSDVKISHIPVILLTVLNNTDNEIEGLESGADDYISKPFSMQLLQSRIANLINNRKALIRKFMMEANFDLSYIARSHTDEKLFARIHEIVEKNMSNYEFTAEEFSREIGMSRSNLHIKLKALTNQSTTEFIRTLRLKKSVLLLAESNLNISEVCYKVGFNNISYFNRCFKKQFGKTPTDFMGKN